MVLVCRGLQRQFNVENGFQGIEKPSVILPVVTHDSEFVIIACHQAQSSIHGKPFNAFYSGSYISVMHVKLRYVFYICGKNGCKMLYIKLWLMGG